MRSVTGVRAVPHLEGGRIELTWQNPSPAAFADGPPLAGIRVVRRERTFPLGPGDGDTLYEGPVVSSFSDRAARPLATHYYTVFTQSSATPAEHWADERSHAAAFATTAEHGLGDALYRLLPAVHRSLDLPLTEAETALAPPAVAAALAALPAGLRERGQLYRFLSVAGAALDLTRSLAEGLRQIHDLDSVRPEFLPPLARLVGWELNRTAPVDIQRSEIASVPYLYRGVGTVPNLRAIVNRYTGWYVQVAETAQSIARSNTAPEFHVFAVTAPPARPRATDDAGPLLGFAHNNASASGTAGAAAALNSSATGPFALRPGMQLTVTADDRVPVKVVFAPTDFTDMAAATSLEVAAVLNRTLSEVTTTAGPDGRLRLTSNTMGAGSAVRVEEALASLVTLEGAPAGRLSVFGTGRPRLCYEVAETPGRPAVRVKTYRRGSWGEANPVPTGPEPAARPAGVELPDDRLFLAWVDDWGTRNARIRCAVATPHMPEPATVGTGHAGPFTLRPGSRLVVRVRDHRQGVRFTAADFATPSEQFPDLRTADAADVAAVLSARLTGVMATAAPDGTVRLVTSEAGGDERLEIELETSDAAGALGFGPGNASAAGSWGDGLDWSPPQDVTGPGWVTDPFAVVDGPHHVRLFWSAHDGARWTIATARWDSSAWSASETVTAGGGGNREAAAIVAGPQDGKLWLFWSRRRATGTVDDVWTLAYRVLDLATGSWGPERELTSPVPDGRSADGEPAPVVQPEGGLRVYFSSDRSGSSGLWALDITPAGVAGEPFPVLVGPEENRSPAPVRAPDGTDSLLFRSDRGVALAGVASREVPVRDNRVTSSPAVAPDGNGLHTSVRTVDTGTLRRYAGTTSAVPAAADRNGRRRQWDDMLSYTPSKPGGTTAGEELDDADLYTRGTLALFLSPLVPESPLSGQMQEQLRPLLTRFLPIGTRAVLVLAPRMTTEYVYPPGRDITESYRDDFTDLEVFRSPEATTEAVLPDWTFLLASTPGHVSANPDDPTTLRRRAWFSPPS
ncbi:hypothetical protein [Streptomyces sp. NPDC096323]|uniref:hypothetical protein n=1 Tax=Streptomyces sp. NPDC096323 TaxID=3155822 RepID=UPI0033317E3B